MLLTWSRSCDSSSFTNITGPITVDSSDSKGVVSRAAQSSDGGSVVMVVVVCPPEHYTVQVDTQTQRDWSPPPDSTVY